MRHRLTSLLALGLIAFSARAGLGAEPPRPPCQPTAADAAAPAEPLVATPCVGGFAGMYPCQNVDLLAFLPLGTIGCNAGNSLWGWTDPLDGREYALMGCDNGISFVDISVPDSPIYLGRLPTHSFNSIWRDVRVYANYAFIVSEASNHGMQVFDLTELRSVPSPPVTFAETAHYSGFQEAHTIAIDEATGFAYAAGSNTCSGGLHMVGISDPLNPSQAGCVSADGYTHETQCVVYAGLDATYAGHEICFSSNEDTLTIIDVTDKSAPVQLSRTGYAGSGYVHQGWLTEDHVHFLHDDELDELNDGHNTYTYIWDVSDLDAPVLMGHYTGPTPAIDHNLYIRGGYAYEANYRAGLRILDISGIASATLVQAGFFDIYPSDNAPEFSAAWNNYPFFQSGNVIVSGIEQGLFVLHPNLNPYPTAISIADATVTEGDSGSVDANFTVSLTAAVPQTVTVQYTTGFGTASGGVDYTSVSGTLTFTPLSTTQTITVPVLGDSLSEADETFLVILTNPTNAILVDGQAIGRILDDDPLPTISIGDTSVLEGNSGTVSASFTVTLSVPSGQTVSAQYSTADGTASAADYTFASGIVSFPVGTTSRTVTVAVKGDLIDEPDETFLLNLANPSHGTLLDAQAVGTILDDDALTVTSVSPASGTAAGGTTVTITGVAFVTGAAVTIGGAAATNVVVTTPGQLTATSPALPAGASNDVVVTNPDTTAATLPAGFFSDFLDVPSSNIFHDAVVTVARNGVTAGCGGGNYCPAASVSRAQMAVFLLKSKFGSSHVPPPATGTVFADVPIGSFAADWIEELASLGVTGGCGGGNYCPGAPVTRAQMAVFLLKTLLGSAYVPPVVAQIFNDVPPGSFAADWINDLATRGITGGCGGGNYCPASPNTRGQMAVFLTRTFGLL